jgi:high-affinity Fe2+/Pb2+ permease
MRDTTIFGCVLLVIAAAMAVTHLRSWRRREHGGMADDERAFYGRQFARRLGTSGLVGGIGLLAVISGWTTDVRLIASIWLGALLLLLVMVLMAGVDWLASRRFFLRALQQQALRRNELLAEVRQLREQRARSE